jgi:hypothetical protein
LFDGKKWHKFLAQFHVKEEDNPQYLLLDMPNKQYWRNETYTKLKDFLIGVYDGSIPAKTADKSGLGDTPLAWMTEKFMAYFPYSLVPILIIIGLVVILVTPSKDDFQPRDDKALEGEEANDTADDAEQTEAKKDK